MGINVREGKGWKMGGNGGLGVWMSRGGVKEGEEEERRHSVAEAHKRYFESTRACSTKR